MPRTRKPSLRAGRPPTAAQPHRTISSKGSQKIIVAFHNLNKELQKAKVRGEPELVASIQDRIEELGGIAVYQEASIQGQRVDRGGDSSVVLLHWLRPVRGDLARSDPKFRLLEVGALSTQNACSTSDLFHVTRIDLHSQSAGIQQQDFMERPLPRSEEEKFDIISLSLVLNFVPDATARGEMLRRTTAFLLRRTSVPGTLADHTALLFLVLPAPCTLNSRYLDTERLALIMSSLGYALLNRKQTSKLVYSIWQLRDSPVPPDQQRFPKIQVRDGKQLNNFHVVLQPESEPARSI